MGKVVVISGHPNLKRSNANQLILDELMKGLKNVEVRQLDVLYPTYEIDIEAEQQALLEAKIVILQFPFYWYSTPALMKKWLDDVFSYDFAYGAKGDKLKGKDCFLSFTIGGPEDSYGPLGYNHFEVESLIRPLEQTVYLTGMNFHQPVYSHGMLYIPNIYNKLDDVLSRARQHATKLISEVMRVQTSSEESVRRFVREWFEQFDQLPEEDGFFTKRLSHSVNWRMPEGTFKGHQGFRDWYQIARSTFLPGCDHQVEQVEVSESESGVKAFLRIRLIAKTFPDSLFEGEDINLLVNETWDLEVDDYGSVMIKDYLVEPV